ncbi:MAG: tRNA-dihydrouridine synthase family protein [Acidobacteriia bacterium]|nr:tRNA-dihydrouridine synthase family protein [Terriglobia bacterium]
MAGGEMFRGRLVMAPMARGTDLPFRRLAAEWGAEVVLGEMAYAHKVAKRERSELALLRRHPSERNFGAQVAGKHPEAVAEAARIAADLGADFVDLNLGCPTDEVTRRGFGAALLERPSRVAALVAAMKAAVPVPVTVKMRLGWSEDRPTALKIALAAQDAGADAVTLHPRSRAQRYRRAADWNVVRELAERLTVPVIGNGDVMTWRDAARRMEESGCASVMVGRWALAKPWIFREFAERRDIVPGPDERLSVVRRYAELCLEHFGSDERGRTRARQFLTFHQDFFRRYRRGAGLEAVNSDDPREWGAQPTGEIEEWLCRADLPATEALCDWLVDGLPPAPPPPAGPDAPRAFKAAVLG